VQTGGFALRDAEDLRRASVRCQNGVVGETADDCRKRAQVEQLGKAAMRGGVRMDGRRSVGLRPAAWRLERYFTFWHCESELRGRALTA
jgi:hypothetical protein